MKKIAVGGELGTFYQNVYENFFKKVDVRKHAEAYRGIHDKLYAEPEFSGKFMEICATYYETRQDELALKKAEQVLRGVRENQREDGYLGTYAAEEELEMFSIWNQAFTMLGLIRIYEVSHNPVALEVSVRCADWIVRRFTEGGADILDSFNGGTQHISVLLAISKLYRITKNPEYMAFLSYVTERLKKGDLNLLSFQNILDLRSKKGIELFVVWLGLLDIYDQTGDERIFSAAKRYWLQVRDTQIRNTGNGTIDEVWTERATEETMIPLSVRPNENCVAVGWIEFSLALFFKERKEQYLDAIEKTIFNHLVGSLSQDGSDFAYYQATFGKKIYQTADYAYKCCRYRGVSAFACLPKYLFYISEGEIIPVVYTECVYEDDCVRIEEKTDYPYDGKIIFKIELYRPYTFRFRIPVWCRNFSVSCDGEIAEKQGETMVFSLSSGKHEIHANLMFSLSVERSKDGDRVAFSYGPLLLAADGLKSGFDPEEFLAAAGAMPQKEGRIFRLNGSEGGVEKQLILTDYSSAGRENPETNSFLIWIRTA